MTRQKWAEKEKVCKKCGERKNISEFPYRTGGTYRKGIYCNSCAKPSETAGEFIGKAFIPSGPKGRRLSPNHDVFTPARVREHDLDPVAQFILNNEGEVVDFEE